MKRFTVIVLIAILAMTLGAVVGCGGDSGGGSGNTPSQVAEKYLKASFALDVDTAYDLLSSADKQNISKEDMEDVAGTAMEGFEYDYEVGEETIEGDTATVAVKVSITDPESGQTEDFEDVLNLVKEDGEWKIYFGDSL